MKNLIAAIVVVAVNAAFGYVSAAVADTMSTSKQSQFAKDSADK